MLFGALLFDFEQEVKEKATIVKNRSKNSFFFFLLLS
jgi:hypothetical protein